MKLPTPIIRYLARLFALVILMPSCTKPLDGVTPEVGTGECAIHFALSGIEGGSSVVVPATKASAGSASTRAASPLAEGLTVRVVVYKYLAIGTFGTAENYVTDQAYVMRNSTLVPCTVDSRGNYTADVPGYTLKLTGDAYNFACYTPALPLASSNKYDIFLSHGMDFAKSLIGNRPIVGSSSTVTFDPLIRQCAKVQLIIAPADPNLAVQVDPNGVGVQMSQFSPGNVIRNYQANTLTATSGNAILTFSPDEFTTYTATHGKAYTTETIILPTASQTVKISCSLLTTTGGGAPVQNTINAELSNQAFESGKSYTVTLFVSSTGITPTIEVEEWGADQALGVRTYPYAAERKYIISKDGFGSSGQLLHPDWTGATPAHADDSGLGTGVNTLSARFQLAIANCNSENASSVTVSNGKYTWTKAAEACAAYKEDGKTWRVPTYRELRAISDLKTDLWAMSGDDYYWSATACNEPDGRCVHFTNSTIQNYRPKGNTYYVRCVRDVPLSPSAYPYLDGQYIVCKDDYGSMVGTFHSPWTDTPVHKESDPANALGAIFEVSIKDVENTWYRAMGIYHATYNPNTEKVCANGWRVPTQEELKVMLKFKSELGLTYQDGFMSATKYTDAPNSYYAYELRNSGSISPSLFESTMVRCVRDIPRIYPYVDQGKYIVFDKMSTGSSLFTSYHPKWETTPQHEFGDPENTIYWKFEVAGADCTRANTGVAKDMDGKYAFTDAAEVCTKYNQGDVTKWRVPTFAELGVIIGFYPQIAGTLRTGTSDSYWTGTYQKISDKMLYFMGVGEMASGGSLASQMHYLRCVRDVD